MLSTSTDNFPLFSIVVLCYNNYSFLLEMLDTVYRQTYPNMELVICDDGSEDFDENNLRAYCACRQPENIDTIIIANERNVGTVRNVELARSHCHGEYIWVLAADDIIVDDDAAIKFFQAFQQVPHDILALCGQVQLFDETMSVNMGRYLDEEQYTLLDKCDSKAQFECFSRECWAPAVGTCYRKQAFQIIGNLSEKYKIIEDWPAYIRLVRAGHALRGISATLVHHRQGGISHGATRYSRAKQKQYSEDLLNVYASEIRPYLKSMPFPSRAITYTRAVFRWVHHRFWPLTFLIDRVRRAR